MNSNRSFSLSFSLFAVRHSVRGCSATGRQGAGNILALPPPSPQSSPIPRASPHHLLFPPNSSLPADVPKKKKNRITYPTCTHTTHTHALAAAIFHCGCQLITPHVQRSSTPNIYTPVDTGSFTTHLSHFTKDTYREPQIQFLQRTVLSGCNAAASSASAGAGAPSLLAGTPAGRRR